MRQLLTALLVCWLVVDCPAQEAHSAAEFAVLRTDRVVVHTGEGAHLNCSIVGVGDEAQISCDSHTGTSVPLVYNVALVVGSNHVGYVISCGGGLVWRIHCRALSAGQVLKGSVQGGKLEVSLDSKTRTYRIETSAYIGPLGGKPSPQESTVSPSSPGDPADDTSTAASVKRTVQVERSGGIGSTAGEQADRGGTPSKRAEVMVSSEPSGADIYVDEVFMGNTPSLVQLVAGSHTVRIEAKGRSTWSRTISLTAGGKVTLQATLEKEH